MIAWGASPNTLLRLQFNHLGVFDFELGGMYTRSHIVYKDCNVNGMVYIF